MSSLEPGKQIGEFAGGEHPVVDLVALQVGTPALVIRQFLLCPAGKDDACPREAGIAAGARIQPVPKPQRLGHQRHLAGIAHRYPHPAPVAARLLVSDAALLAQRHPQSSLGELKCGGRPDDAAADHHNIARFGKLFIPVNGDDVRTGHESISLTGQYYSVRFLFPPTLFRNRNSAQNAKYR
jgi:hypothetical protein